MEKVFHSWLPDGLESLFRVPKWLIWRKKRLSKNKKHWAFLQQAYLEDVSDNCSLFCDGYLCSKFYHIPHTARRWQSTWSDLHISGFTAQASTTSWQVYHVLTKCNTFTRDTTCHLTTQRLSFVSQIQLSKENIHFSIMPVKLTVSAHPIYCDISDLSQAVTSSHNLSEAVTSRWSQSRSVISLCWCKDFNTFKCWLKVLCPGILCANIARCIIYQHM